VLATIPVQKRYIYILLCCGCVTISFNVAAVAASIPAISQDLRLADWVVSKIISAYMIPYGIGALFYAPLTRHFSYRSILAAAFFVYACSSLYCGVASSVEALKAGCVVMGLSGAAAIPVGLLLIGQLFEKNIRGRLVGLFFTGSFVSSTVGIVCAGLMSWRWLFYIPAILGAITMGLAFLGRADLLKRVNGVAVNYLAALRHQGIREIFIFIFVISLLYHGVHRWFGIYLAQMYHLDKMMISWFFLGMSLSGGIGQMVGGYVSDIKGRYRACLLGLVILALSTMALWGHYPLPLVGIILGLVTVGWTIGHNGLSTVLTDFPETHLPEIASLNSAVRFLSGGVGFYLSSFFVEKSFAWTFLGIGILMLGLMVFLRRIVPE